jgi:hypothetical protein
MLFDPYIYITRYTYILPYLKEGEDSPMAILIRNNMVKKNPKMTRNQKYCPYYQLLPRFGLTVARTPIAHPKMKVDLILKVLHSLNNLHQERKVDLFLALKPL